MENKLLFTFDIASFTNYYLNEYLALISLKNEIINSSIWRLFLDALKLVDYIHGLSEYWCSSISE